MGAIMTSRQAAELDHAFERNGLTAEDVKNLCKGKILADIREVLVGYAEIKPIKRELDFKVWKTINLGKGPKNGGAFRNALEAEGYEIGGRVTDVFDLGIFKVAKKETEVNLVSYSYLELGLKYGAPLIEVHRKAESLGLEICPLEVGPQLRLQYRDQPMGQWLLIAHQPLIFTPAGQLPDTPSMFCIGHSGMGCWISTLNEPPDIHWKVDVKFVFVLPRR